MWTGVVTNAGAALLAQWAGGGELQITKAAAGTGTVSTAALINSTALVSEKQTLAIVDAVAEDGGMKYSLQFVAATAAYTANQIGIWAKLGTGSAVLLAIYQDNTGIAVPAAADMPDYVYTFYATVQMDNTGDLDVTIDTTALVSQADLEEAVAATNEALDGKAAADHGHALTDNGITGTLPISKGGTGATDVGGVKVNLGLQSVGQGLSINQPTGAGQVLQMLANVINENSELNGKRIALLIQDGAIRLWNATDGVDIWRLDIPVSVLEGGTGATDAATARTNLGITPSNIGAAATNHGHALTDSGVTGTLPISKGGTNATDAATARTNLGITPSNIGAAASSHTHALTGDALTGTLPASKGGTGLTSSPSMRVNLATEDTDDVLKASPRPGVTGTLGIGHGGTGATTAAAALAALGGFPAANVANNTTTTSAGYALDARQGKTLFDMIAARITNASAGTFENLKFAADAVFNSMTDGTIKIGRFTVSSAYIYIAMRNSANYATLLCLTYNGVLTQIDKLNGTIQSPVFYVTAQPN